MLVIAVFSKAVYLRLLKLGGLCDARVTCSVSVVTSLTILDTEGQNQPTKMCILILGLHHLLPDDKLSTDFLFALEL